jgi:hypothetical protein
MLKSQFKREIALKLQNAKAKFDFAKIILHFRVFKLIILGHSTQFLSLSGYSRKTTAWRAGTKYATPI